MNGEADNGEVENGENGEAVEANGEMSEEAGYLWGYGLGYYGGYYPYYGGLWGYPYYGGYWW